MGYVPGFQHDVFISYAHVDNAPLPTGQEGWVKLLEEYLKARLPVLLGHPKNLSIWRDPKLNLNEKLNEVLHDRYRRSAVMVFIHSRSSLESEWCQKELNGFCAHKNPKFGLFVDKKARVFLVRFLPVDNDVHSGAIPAELRGETGSYDFFEIDSETDEPRQLWPKRGPEANEEYVDVAEALIRDIAELLRNMASANRPCVYLAEVTDDLRLYQRQVASALRQKGIGVHPNGSLPSSAGELNTQTKQELEAARLSVHMLGKYYGRTPDDDDRSISRIQLENARDAGRPVIVWIPPGLNIRDIEDVKQIGLIKEAERITDAVLTDFQRSVGVEELIRIVANAAFAEEPSHFREVRQTCACITFRQPDKSKDTARVGECLEKNGVDIYVSDVTEAESTPELRHAFEDLIKAVDALVIYYGKIKPILVQSLLARVRNAGARLREDPFRALAIYDAPHELHGEKPDHGIKAKDVVVIDCRSGHQRSAMEPLIAKIKGQQA